MPQTSTLQPLSPVLVRARDCIKDLIVLARQAVSMPANICDLTTNIETINEAEFVHSSLTYQDVAASPLASNGLRQVRASLQVEEKVPCSYWSSGTHNVVEGLCRCGETFVLYRARTAPPEGAKITTFENVKVHIPAVSDEHAYDTLCATLESIPGCEYMTDSYSSQETGGEDRDTSELFGIEQ
jgi:hypothetical protein